MFQNLIAHLQTFDGSLRVIIFINTRSLPANLDDCHRLIASLQSQVDQDQGTIGQQASKLQQVETQLAIKDKLIEEQAHSVLELKAASDQRDQKIVELNLTIEKLLKRLYGRKSKRRIECVGQLLLELGEEATPEVVSALEEAIREAEQIVEQAEESKKNSKPKRPPRPSDRKFPEHLPRYEKIIDVPEEKRQSLVLIEYDEVETLEMVRAELRVCLTKYAKYAAANDKSAGIVSPERPTGLVEGNRFDVSIGVEVVAAKYFFHLPFYRQQNVFAGLGWTPSRSTLQNIESAVEFALRPLADYLRGFLKQDRTIGCDDTSVLLIVPNALPDLTGHPRRDRIEEVLAAAIENDKPSISAKMWGYYASRLPVMAFDFTVRRGGSDPRVRRHRATSASAEPIASSIGLVRSVSLQRRDVDAAGASQEQPWSGSGLRAWSLGGADTLR